MENLCRNTKPHGVAILKKKNLTDSCAQTFKVCKDAIAFSSIDSFTRLIRNSALHHHCVIKKKKNKAWINEAASFLKFGFHAYQIVKDALQAQ